MGININCKNLKKRLSDKLFSKSSIGEVGCLGWGIAISKELIEKADSFLYNCNITRCSPSSGKMYSTESLPSDMGMFWLLNLNNLQSWSIRVTLALRFSKGLESFSFLISNEIGVFSSITGTLV